MVNQPQSGGRPQVEIYFKIGRGGGESRNWGHLFTNFEFKAMVNGGYIVRATLVDSGFNLLKSLVVEQQYLRSARQDFVQLRFRISHGPGSESPRTATNYQTAIVISLDMRGSAADAAYLEFIAIDPPSWYLNAGDGSGRAYRGNISRVIRSVCNDYAPAISVDVGETTDSANGVWHMMRQDPKTFIKSLTEWSSSLTQNLTQWMIAADGHNLTIKEQAQLPTSRSRGYYRYWHGKSQDSIKDWELLANNALSMVDNKIVTHGMSAISGQYIDRTSEQLAVVDDETTPSKLVARITERQGFTKPQDAGPPTTGWTAVRAIPEFSAGDIGKRYNEYIDGRARGYWLGLVNSLMRIKLTVIGHGEWNSCNGLGVDTIFVKWRSSLGKGDNTIYFLTGSWVIYGFHHHVRRGEWTTDLYCARFDHDSNAAKVGT